ncbi:MAG: phosphoenolpyruvate--protein phosphotransferase [Rhodospirillaceae bacterium]|jgi:phosphotransferase system, enzyme I, PtsP|nr:phosphoenolpyruvate--protein phosphotransferase [Rhodospirillaceae bacterium]MBT4589876.1 phosphoenolpyruvate--protein phosphotransferase [Rhodospirillaceae bacterium]MBT4939596.1 phosphoenolpyruvate--protein phosphotransferase [Rhodospirillaceae bacterium]MBT5941659.1 phosphoenolpyruvate--protein phosphotransferase [Rhodospirillaceae bacterium]MBT7267359.1 phosphoenolpyruvate--protein phosphotransferase [Rhodospirillaceae bacterium]
MVRIPTMTGSRRLLARLRDVMAGAGTSQERLDQIVSIIASDFVAEVCSVYVLRAGEVLELFAATGLASEAIHNTRLSIGEGLIGRIAVQARPLALADAQSHPDYAYRPETGEEIFQSLAGVPILRGGRVTGVLAVQNRTGRAYTEEEVETLETTAMVIAELIASSDLFSPEELHAVDGVTLLSITLDGVRLNGGLALGEAVRHERRIQILKLVSDDPVAEQRRLDNAVAEMHGAIDEMLEAKDVAEGGEHRDILETYKMFAEDAGWLARISEAITNGLTAEAAVEKVRNDTRARFRKQTDRYLRERLHDFDDLAHRLLQHLVGIQEISDVTNMPENIILFARNMGPAELLDYDRTHLRGLVLEEGSATTHVAIVARALDIPVVGRAAEVLDKVETGDTVIVDGDNAQIHIRPANDTQQAFVDTLTARAQKMATYAALRDVPAETKDGIQIALHMNAGLLADMQNIPETGADGIGLYRTEIPFMDSSDFPDVDRQAELYGRVIEQSGGKPVVFRTLDVGGDKGLPYWDTGNEENPAMGWRAIRVALDRPALMRHQLRALIRAAQDRDLSIMFPMITEIAEFDAAKKILDMEIKRALKKGRTPIRNLRVGTMLEVPALAFQMPALLKRVDFISIGSNDLFQFLFASDRGSPLIADRYDPLSPAGLHLLQSLIEQCDAASVPISLCGEMAGRPLDAMALIGLGFRTLSMAPSSIGPVKTMIRSLTAGDLTRYLESLQDVSEHSLREKLREFALDHGVMI